MNPNRLVVGCRFCALLVATWMAAEKVSGDSWVAVNAEGAVTVQHILAAQAPKLDVHGYDANRIDLVVTTLGLGLEPRTTKAGEFVKLTWPDSPAYGEVGTPALPAVRRLFVAPMDADVRVSVMEGDPAFVDTQTVGFPLRVLPVQPPIPKWPGARARAEFVFDQLAYGVNQNLLPERAVVKELGIVRGQRLFLLEVRPVDYNPVAQVLTLWPNIEAEIEFVGKSSSRSKLTSLPGLHHILLNPDLDAPAERGSDNYLIVVADAFEMDIAVFAAAKVAQGFTVTTHVVSAGTSNDVIKAYIENQWSDPGTAPDYVLLVGDTNSIPYWVGDGTGSPDTDLPYACMDGPGDWYPDIAIGRFAVSSVSELQAAVDKTLFVEAGVFSDPDYVRRAAFLATDDSTAQAEQNHDWVISTYMDPAEFVSTKIMRLIGHEQSPVREMSECPLKWLAREGGVGR